MLHEVDLQASRCISLECEVDLLFAFDRHIGQHLRVEPSHRRHEEVLLLDAGGCAHQTQKGDQPLIPD